MKLHSIRIHHLRSVEDASVVSLGGFNVLIGKNNSGKSTILSAIDAFFRSLKDGKIIDLSPTLGREIDFFRQEVGTPITIHCCFSMASDERDAILRAVVAEAPQMKHAIDALGNHNFLLISFHITRAPLLFAYVSSIRFCDAATLDSAGQNCASFLRIDENAASELYDQFAIYARAVQNSQTGKKLLSRIGNERSLAETIKSDRVRFGQSPLSYFASEINELDPRIRDELNRLFKDADDIPSFVGAAQSLLESVMADANSRRGAPLANKVQTFAGEEPIVPEYATEILRRVGILKLLHLREHRKPIGKEEARRLLDLKVTRGGPEILHEIQETVSALLGVRIDAFQSSSGSRTQERGAELDVDNFLVEVNGSGIREALRLILDYEFETPDILLVEEPEVHLHPALEISMMRYLKRLSTHTQVFITTHSTNFLDTTELRNVYLISKRDSTRVALLDLEAAEAQLPAELGLRLSSFFLYDQLVFVEGRSDENVLREFAAKLNLNLGGANTGFVSIGGVRNFAHYATESILTLLTRRQVKMWFVVDRDERDDDEVRRMEARLSDRAELHVLAKREIENYLLLPRPVAEFLSQKAEGGGVVPREPISSERVSALLDEKADLLKDFSIRKRVLRKLVSPLYPMDEPVVLAGSKDAAAAAMSQQVEALRHRLSEWEIRFSELLDQETEEVDKIWARQKRNIVPGDLLLDEVAKVFGMRFNKEKDAPRLAALLKPEEIDIDIRTLLENIVRR